MIERIVPRRPNRFLLCAGCGRQPHHVLSHGRSAAEPAIIWGEATTRHKLECTACSRSTGRHATLDAAESEWGQKWAQLPLPLTRARRAAA